MKEVEWCDDGRYAKARYEACLRVIIGALFSAALLQEVRLFVYIRISAEDKKSVRKNNLSLNGHILCRKIFCADLPRNRKLIGWIFGE